MAEDINVFDPKEFDQNSFEWGAIYWINKIRESVEGFDEGYEIPDEQMLDMLAPFKKAAKVYAEAQGKNKAWVKETVLSVPETLEQAFGTLSEEGGVTRERFLKLFTVEAVCALAKGKVKSIHDIEDYYDGEGIYKGKGGYKVGDYVVIEEHVPSGIEDVEKDRDIKQVLAILGDEDNGEVELVFWNARKTGVMMRKASDCSEPFPSWEAAMEYKWDDVTTPLGDAGQSEESKVYDELYGAILESMGVVEDAEPDMADADFWEKHDKARHGGHFDPETMTCKLREKYAEGEKIETLKDEMDDMLGETPDVPQKDFRSFIEEKKRKLYKELQKRNPKQGIRDLTRDLMEVARMDKQNPQMGRDAAKWLLKGIVKYPEDMYKVVQARELAARAKDPMLRDPFRFGTPQEFINTAQEQGVRQKERPITVEELKHNPLMSDYRDEGHGVETFEVEDSPDGQKLMREIINTHFGKDANPWCLLHGDGEGNISDGENGDYDAWEYWQNYSALPKRVAFKDGKLIAFMATEGNEYGPKMESHRQEWKESEDWQKYSMPFENWMMNNYPDDMDIGEEWWDRNDKSHRGVPVGSIPIEGDPEGRQIESELKGGKIVPIGEVMTKGKKGKPGYQEWDAKTGEKKFRIGDNGEEIWYENGEAMTLRRYDDQLRSETFEWVTDREGKKYLARHECYDGTLEYLYPNGMRRGMQKRGKTIQWYPNGYKEYEVINGKQYYWDENGELIEPKDAIHKVEYTDEERESMRQTGPDPEAYRTDFSNVPTVDTAIGEDALDPSDPDFWMKHDRAHHHGHFDPNTQTCKLREEAKAQEVKREQIDMQIDDLRGETPFVKPAPSKHQAKIKELSGFLATKGLGEDTIKSAKIIASLPTASQIVKVAQKIKKTSTPRVRKVAAGEFYKTINNAVSTRPESDRWRVEVHPIEDYEKYKCFVSEGGSVFALNGEEIVSVCKNRNDNGISGKSLLAAAVEEGGRKLDSYEGNHAFYAKCGFEPVSWTKFNPEYAPKGALPEDIIFYKYTGHKRDLDKAGVEKEIIDFKRSIEAMEYDDAGEYRDTQMG